MNLLTVTDFAARTGIPAESVRRYCRLGILPGAVRMGRDWIIPSESITWRPATAGKRGNPNFGPDFWADREKIRKKPKRKSK